MSRHNTWLNPERNSLRCEKCRDEIVGILPMGVSTLSTVVEAFNAVHEVCCDTPDCPHGDHSCDQLHPDAPNGPHCHDECARRPTTLLDLLLRRGPELLHDHEWQDDPDDLPDFLKAVADVAVKESKAGAS